MEVWTWHIRILLLSVIHVCVQCIYLKNLQNVFSATGGEAWIQTYAGRKPESGVLECKFGKTNDTKENVITICVIKDSTCTYSPQYNERLDLIMSNITIHLGDLRKEDSGRYSCSITKLNSSSITTYLQVLDPVSDLHVNVTYDRSSYTAKFQCIFSGDYETISWQKDGQNISSDFCPTNPSDLIIRNKDLPICGYYSCIVVTHIGSFKNGSNLKIPSSNMNIHMFRMAISSFTLSILDILTLIIILLVFQNPTDTRKIVAKKSCLITYKLGTDLNIAVFIAIQAMWVKEGVFGAICTMVPFIIGFIAVSACLLKDFISCAKCFKNTLFLHVFEASPHVMNFIIPFSSFKEIYETNRALGQECENQGLTWIVVLTLIIIFVYLVFLFGSYKCNKPRGTTIWWRCGQRKSCGTRLRGAENVSEKHPPCLADLNLLWERFAITAFLLAAAATGAWMLDRPTSSMALSVTFIIQWLVMLLPFDNEDSHFRRK